MNLYQLSQPNADYFPQNLARLLVAICNTCATIGTFKSQQVIGFHQHIQLPGPPAALPRIPILGDFKGQVIKVYHPPIDEDAALWYRRPTLYPALLPGSEIKVDTHVVQVLTYPWIDGQVCPPVLQPRHFLMAARELQRYYNSGLRAHGDVRLANLIVSEEQVHWIDFDYSVLQTEEPRYYPESWNLQISDGTRHPDSLHEMRIRSSLAANPSHVQKYPIQNRGSYQENNR